MAGGGVYCVRGAVEVEMGAEIVDAVVEGICDGCFVSIETAPYAPGYIIFAAVRSPVLNVSFTVLLIAICF